MYTESNWWHCLDYCIKIIVLCCTRNIVGEEKCNDVSIIFVQANHISIAVVKELKKTT